ncbi:MAG: ATP-binding protein [Gammaproteobacteria bacterium]|nr:ATP-binding protein [Gammaproteobacteria bacterium]
MPRHLIRKYLPDAVKLRDHPQLRRFGHRLHDPSLWHLNRRSISGGVALGLFCALLPIPGQLLLGPLLAIWLRVNLPATVVLIFTTNPLTMPPVFYSTYRLGAWLLGEPPVKLDFTLTWEALHTLGSVWQPLLLGSLIAGVLAAALGYVSVRLLWRLYVIRRYRRRKVPVPRELS